MLHAIGETARLTRCNIETIRYYERIGLLSRPARSEGGHRLYDDDAVGRLNFIRRCRELGFPLNDVRELLGLVDGGAYTCADVKSLTLGHLATVREKIATLRRMERVLDDMAERCAGGTVPDCPILEALFEGA